MLSDKENMVVSHREYIFLNLPSVDLR